MNNTFLKVPDSDVTLYPGSVVKLSRFPDVTWVLRFGGYHWDNKLNIGWNFLSLTDQTILPVILSDLTNIVVVDSDDIMYRKDTPPKRISGEIPEDSTIYPEPAYVSVEDKARYDAAFITLADIEEVRKLEETNIPDGKIIKVNDIDGEVKYFTWNKSTLSWEDVDFAFLSDLQELAEQIPKWSVSSLSNSEESDGD